MKVKNEILKIYLLFDPKLEEGNTKFNNLKVCTAAV